MASQLAGNYRDKMVEMEGVSVHTDHIYAHTRPEGRVDVEGPKWR